MAGITAEDIETASDPAVGWLTEKAKQFSDDADELRATTDRAAKGLGALATAGLTAAGIAKVGDLYPRPDGGYWPTFVFLWLGFVFMVVAIVAFVYRFWRANRPLPLSARVAEMCDGKNSSLARDECDEVARIYDDAMAHAAFPEGKESLAHYEWRAERLERVALYAPDSPGSAHRLAQVERMRAEIEKAEERAKLVVVRRRMNRVFNHWIAAVFAVMFVVGLVMFATAADYFDDAHPKKTDTTSQVENGR